MKKKKPNKLTPTIVTKGLLNQPGDEISVYVTEKKKTIIKKKTGVSKQTIVCHPTGTVITITSRTVVPYIEDIYDAPDDDDDKFLLEVIN